MDNIIGEREMEGLREDIRSLTRAVLSVGAVLLSGLNVYTGSADLVRGREEVERMHGRFNVDRGA